MSMHQNDEPQPEGHQFSLKIKKASGNINLPKLEDIDMINAYKSDPYDEVYVSPTIDTTQTHTNGIPNDPQLLAEPLWLDANDATVFSNNLRLKLTDLPYLTIDPSGE